MDKPATTVDSRDTVPLARSLIQTVMSAVGARAGTIAVGLITTPLLLNYLGATDYGAYSAVLALGAFMIVADQGFSAPVRTEAARTAVPGVGPSGLQVRLAGRVIAYRVAGALIVLAILGGATLPWGRWLGHLPTAVPAPVVVTSFLAIAAAITVAAVDMRYLEGTGRADFVARLPVLASFWLGATVVLGILLGAPWLYFVVAGAMVGLPALLVTRRMVDRQVGASGSSRPPKDLVAHMWGASWPMAIVSVMLAASYSIDPLIITAVLGPQSTADYSVSAKIAQFAGLAVSAVSPVLWSHFARRHASGAPVGAGQAVRLTGGLIGLALAVSFALAVLGPTFARVWTSGAIVVDYPIFVAFGALATATAAQIVPATMQTDAVGLRFQAMTTTLMAALNVLGSVLLAQHIGIAGPVVASGVALVLCHALPLWVRQVVLWRST